MHLFLASFFEHDLSNIAVFGFLAVGAIALFGIFLPISSWADARRREREAYYKAETLRRIAESTTEGAKAAIELMREQERQARLHKREGMKVGGLINLFLGIALTVFIYALLGPHSPYLCGLILVAIGAALLIYVFFMAEPIE
jgi:Flp pilus assembly protein TadB